MESVDAKMIRAHQHLETLEKEISEYLSTIKPMIVLKTAAKEPWPWLVMWVNDYIPPIRLSVLLGDCVHNMRSALDNLICGLARPPIHPAPVKARRSRTAKMKRLLTPT
jgi:hypothetical protein